MILLQANQVARHFGSETLFENIHLEIATKSRIALVGRNGAGKSTFLKIIAGIDAPDSGTIAKNKTATLGYLAQNTGLESDKTVWEEMTKAFADILEMEQRMRELETKISEMEPTTSVYEGILKEYDQLQHTFSEKKKMATAMKMKFAQSFTALALMNPFTRKIFKPYLVVKKPGLH